jgi:hypothetical protein
MSPVLERTQHPHEAWTREHWLGHCEGYRVESDEDLLGWVEEVLWTPDESEPLCLRVREGLAILIVPVDDIVEICPAAERILVQAR